MQDHLKLGYVALILEAEALQLAFLDQCIRGFLAQVVDKKAVDDERPRWSPGLRDRLHGRSEERARFHFQEPRSSGRRCRRRSRAEEITPSMLMVTRAPECDFGCTSPLTMCFTRS